MTNHLDFLDPYNNWTGQLVVPAGIPRSSYLATLDAYCHTDSIIIVAGQRRTGKSVVLQQFIAALREQGVDHRNILYMNMFIDDFEPLKEPKEFKAAVASWDKEISAPIATGFKYIVVDEITEVKGWQKIIASLKEDARKRYKIIVSGSNSQLLLGDMPTELRGRYYSLIVRGFSFAEFCLARSCARTLEAFSDYLLTGGMPEIVMAPTALARGNLIRNIIDSTVKKDLIDRYGADPELTDKLINFMRRTFSCKLSVKSVLRQLGSNDHAKVTEHLQWIEHIYWAKFAPIYSERAKDELHRGERKVYLGDHAFTLSHKLDKGLLLENAIFNGLAAAGYDVWTYSGQAKGKQFEIDFLAKRDGRVLYVQVAWQVGDRLSTTFEREFSNFDKIGHHKGEKMVVSMDPVLTPQAGIVHLNPHRFLEAIDG